MKSDEDVRMISAEAPVVFAKACEMFILELTMRTWNVAKVGGRQRWGRGRSLVGEWVEGRPGGWVCGAACCAGAWLGPASSTRRAGAGWTTRRAAVEGGGSSGGGMGDPCLGEPDPGLRASRGRAIPSPLRAGAQPPHSDSG